jgi:hypothetical protein
MTEKNESSRRRSSTEDGGRKKVDISDSSWCMKLPASRSSEFRSKLYLGVKLQNWL